MSLDANANRFSGFADLYDAVRPVPPMELADVITTYAGDRPTFIVDLGCGTGLSSRWAARWSNEVVGIEPSADMRVRAADVTADANVRYVHGWSNATGLPDGCADVVLAVQALHWMEPTGTFDEVARLLRPGGVFAALDCDWPPSIGNAVAEQSWHTTRATIAVHEREVAGWGRSSPSARAPSSSPQTDELRPINSDDSAAAVTITDGVQFWHKNEHLARMIRSQQFQHCVEIAALGEERGDADRFVQLFKSQGDYQALRRHGFDDATLGVDRFSADVAAAVGSGDFPLRTVRLVIARCSVDYAGRLTAHLPEAVRLIMVKADGCVAIHADGGAYKPLNWMNAPNVLVTGDSAWTVTNPKGESLTITLHEVLSDTEAEFGDDPGLQKDGVEAHLQELLAASPHTIEEGLTLVRREYPTAIGPIDLLCRDRDGQVVAIEVKRRGEIDGVEQLARYIERLHLDSSLGSVRGVYVAQIVKPQARVLAESRGFRVVEVDYDELRGLRADELRLF